MFHEFKFWREMFQDVFIESRAGLAPDGREGGWGVRCPGEQLIDGGTAASGASHADESIEVTSLGFSPFFSSSSFFWLHQKRGRLGGPKEKNPKGFFR